MLVLQQQQRLQQARAERAGLPVPPPATGKGGRGKLVFPQSDSFRFVLHIRELTQNKNLAGVLAALTIAERKEGRGGRARVQRLHWGHGQGQALGGRPGAAEPNAGRGSGAEHSMLLQRHPGMSR